MVPLKKREGSMDQTHEETLEENTEYDAKKIAEQEAREKQEEEDRTQEQADKDKATQIADQLKGGEAQADQLRRVLTREDTLEGLSLEDFRNKTPVLTEGIDFPFSDARKAMKARGLQGDVEEEVEADAQRYDENNIIRDILFDKTIAGTLTPLEKEALAEYLMKHRLISFKNGKPVDNGVAYSYWGDSQKRHDEIWNSPFFKEVLDLVNASFVANMRWNTHRKR